MALVQFLIINTVIIIFDRIWIIFFITKISFSHHDSISVTISVWRHEISVSN